MNFSLKLEEVSIHNALYVCVDYLVIFENLPLQKLALVTDRWKIGGIMKASMNESVFRKV